MRLTYSADLIDTTSITPSHFYLKVDDDVKVPMGAGVNPQGVLEFAVSYGSVPDDFWFEQLNFDNGLKLLDGDPVQPSGLYHFTF